MFRTLAAVSLIFGLSFSFVATAQNRPADRDVVVGINDALIPQGLVAGQNVVAIVSGIFPNGCYRWKGADVRHRSQFHHEVLPIAAVSQGMCIMVLIPFTKEIALGPFAAGEHTVRFVSGDGTYLEKIVRIEQ